MRLWDKRLARVFFSHLVHFAFETNNHSARAVDRKNIDPYLLELDRQQREMGYISPPALQEAAIPLESPKPADAPIKPVLLKNPGLEDQPAGKPFEIKYCRCSFCPWSNPPVAMGKTSFSKF